MSDVADDDLLLNTGVSFPDRVHARVDQRRRSEGGCAEMADGHGIVGYSYLRGVGELPITGGLFLGEEAAALLRRRNSFPVTQDQRHTIRSRIS